MDATYQLYIELTGNHPKVWRRLNVSGNTDFDYLHDMIQITLYGSGYKLGVNPYEFVVNGVRVYSFETELDMGSNPSEKDAMEWTLEELVTEVDAQFTYAWGDGRLCQIKVEKIERLRKPLEYPICTGGEAVLEEARRFNQEEVNVALRYYIDGWGDGDEDEADEGITFEDFMHLRTPRDLLTDEIEELELQHRVKLALLDKDNLEYDTWTRLKSKGNGEEESRTTILEALAVERFYELKYGVDYGDRLELNLQHLPEAPIEIPSLDFAIRVLENSTRGIPFAAIGYLHDDTSAEATSAIIRALNDFADDDNSRANNKLAPIWYAMAAEGHLCEDLIDPVVNLFKYDNVNTTDILKEQGEFLIGKLAQKYPDAVVQKVLAVLEEDATQGGWGSVYFLFDAFQFCDVDKYKGRLLKLLERDDLDWHNMVVATVAYMQIKEALPILKKQLKRRSKVPFWQSGEVKEAIEQLESGELLSPDLDMARCLQRGSWRDEYADMEEYFL